MSRFATNEKVASGKTLKAQTTTNNAGGPAFKLTPELELVQLLAASKLQDQAYRTGEETVNRLSALVAAVSPEFAAKAALYTRHTFDMRSTSHLVAAELSQRIQGLPWGKRFFENVAFRPDDVTEITAAVIAKFGKKRITNAMRRGFGSRLTKFDGYQIAKWAGNGDFKLIDAINLINPSFNPVLKSFVAGTLKPAETWEVKRTVTGQKNKQENVSEEDAQEAQAQNWRDLIDNGRLPYFAAVRNVRTILAEAPDKAAELAALISDEKNVAKSKLFPYHFYLANKALLQGSVSKESRIVAQALNKALEFSVKNVPELFGTTLIAVDHSGSMTVPVSYGKDKTGQRKTGDVSVSSMEAADLFAAIMAKATNADVIRFGSNAEYTHTNLDDTVVTIAKSLASDMGGTNFNSIFATANKPYDRVIVLTDGEHWQSHNPVISTVKAYAKAFGKQPVVYLWTLAAYETSPLPETWFRPLAGFSPNVFSVIANSEVDPRALLKEIEAVEL